MPIEFLDIIKLLFARIARIKDIFWIKLVFVHQVGSESTWLVICKTAYAALVRLQTGKVYSLLQLLVLWLLWFFQLFSIFQLLGIFRLFRNLVLLRIFQLLGILRLLGILPLISMKSHEFLHPLTKC